MEGKRPFNYSNVRNASETSRLARSKRVLSNDRMFKNQSYIGPGSTKYQTDRSDFK